MKETHATMFMLVFVVAALFVGCNPAEVAVEIGEGEREDTFASNLIPLSRDNEPLWERPATIEDRMAHSKTPAVGVAIINDFEIVWAGGYGVTRAGGEVAADAETLFHAGSVAKPVSTAAVLTLVERGELDLDANVNDRLVTWKIPDNGFTTHEKVTLRRLLSHSGGIQDGITNRSSGDRLPNYLTPAGTRPSIALADLLDAKPGVDVDGPTRVVSIPGSEYRYANADFVLVEVLVNDATGTQFDAFMQSSVLDPLRMTSSTYEQPLPERLRARAAVEHDFKGRPIKGDRLHIPFLAAGGLWTTPSDLARFAIEIMNAYRGTSDRLLSREMAAEMLAAQIAITGNPLADAMALGFERSGSDSDFAVLHTGGTWGSTAIVWAYPETGQGAVIMTNSATGSLLRIEILLGIALEYGWPMVQ